LIFSSGENCGERDDCDSRSWKSSETSCGAAAAAAEAYLRQHPPTAVAAGRASRNASLLSEDGSSRKAIVSAAKKLDHPESS
jgi:hypothetical protein